MHENAAYSDTKDADGGVQRRKKSENVSHVTKGSGPWTAYACCNHLFADLPLVRRSTYCGAV